MVLTYRHFFHTLVERAMQTIGFLENPNLVVSAIQIELVSTRSDFRVIQITDFDQSDVLTDSDIRCNIRR